MPPKASKRKAANGYKLPDPVPLGTIVTGTNKKQFRVGKSIGVGGFGEIYLVSEDISRAVGDDAHLAMKIEPHENGPLFVEMNFYIRAAQPQMVEEFKKAKNLKSFGMPCLRGSGSHLVNGTKYRFLVMDRYGKDLQKVFQSGKKLFSDKVTFNLALKVLDSLEYIHAKNYVHNDIKAQNLLLGYGRSKENDVFLLDFGLVSKYRKCTDTESVHNEYKPDARKAHDGTIEYTSRDAHIGAHSRRSDLEILAYNLVHWMSGDLPWMDNLGNPDYVHAQKKGYMNDVKAFLSRCFKSEDYPAVLEEFLNYVVKLEFDTEPDYDKCRKMFKSALTKAKYPLDGKIDFSTPKNAPKKARKRKRSDFEDLDFSEDVSCRKSTRNKNNSENGRISAPHPTPAASPTPEESQWSWEKVLCSDPEMLIRQASRQSETEDDSPLALQHKALEEKRQAESLKNPTDAMKEILKRMEERENERENMTWSQQLQHFKELRNQFEILAPNPLTPAMEEVIAMRQKRISVEIDVPITPEPSDSEDDCSSHEEYRPRFVVKKKISPNKKVDLINSPFEFRDDDDEVDNIGRFRSCINVVNTSVESLTNTTTTVTSTANTSLKSTSSSRRRISIQNEATPIRNKESPPEPKKQPVANKKQPVTNKKQPVSSKKQPIQKKKKGRKPATTGKKPNQEKGPKAKRLSSIPEEVFIESIQSIPEEKPKRRGRPPTAKRRKIQVEAKPVPAEIKPIPVEIKPASRKNVARKNMRSSTMRTTRAQELKWENVLLQNPEKILKKKK